MPKLSQFKRKQFLHINKYQQQMMVPIFICCFVSCLVILLAMVFLYSPETVFTRFEEENVGVIIPIIMIVLSLTIMFVVLWTYRVSSRMVGAFDRIIRELDDVLNGTRSKTIGTRKGDVMFEELLKRINALIQKVYK